MLRIARWIRITPERVTTPEGVLFAERQPDAELLVYAYRAAINDYPKFFKMDGLSRLGFVASELLLRGAAEQRAETLDETRAVILFSRGGSVSNDRHYQTTIADPANFFPSPAIFVYTLPNIVAGEIAIRNRCCGETACYLLDAWDAETVAERVAESFADDPTIADALVGWVDYLDAEHFEALLLRVVRSGGAADAAEAALKAFDAPTMDELKQIR